MSRSTVIEEKISGGSNHDPNTSGVLARENQEGKGKNRGGRARERGVGVICLCYDY